MAKQLKTFVLHDESINTHGFRMLTAGADLTEFYKNPVMLLNHDGWELPIGKWVNIRVEESKILADADFDLGDDKAREIARKVDEGYIKACSIGAWAVESSNDPSVMLPGQKYSTITKWKVREASICTIGANHNALALYDAYGSKINMEDPTDIETVIQLIDNKPTKKVEKMNKDLLKLLSLSDNASEQEAVRAVEKLQLENKELSDQLKAIRDAKAEALRAEALELTDAAIRAGQLDAGARESTLELFSANHEATKVMLASLPKRQSVTSQLTNSDEKDGGLLSMSWDELDRNGLLAELKDKYIEVYKEKFKERFGRDPQ